MRMYDIITKKRNGLELDKTEIEFFIQGYVKGDIPDYQASALLMAIYFEKMSKKETVYLTNAMIDSGDKIDLSSIDGIKVDKHSTGGVGDKTTLVVAPLVAAAGVPVAKMSGRGLGYTGGTIDKLESFKGFTVEIDNETFIDNVNKYKIAVVAQTGNLVPADKKLYALRDVTGTIENISLIASSIMSKKLASGADAIVLDVKTGSGAFMKSLETSIELAKQMVDIGNEVGKKTIAVVTDMDEPLGNAIGNALEVKEAINTLKGNGPEDLTQLCLTIGAYMLILAGLTTDFEQAKGILQSKIDDGSGLLKLKQMVEAQGGNKESVDDFSLLPQADHIFDIYSNATGYIKFIKADDIGLASLIIGAGRETKESIIDLGAGIVLLKKVGDFVHEGEILAQIHLNNLTKENESKKMIADAYQITKDKVFKPKLIKAIITEENIEIF